MDQDLSSYGIRPVEPAAQFYAPVTAGPANVPQYTSPTLPAPMAYTPPQPYTSTTTPNISEGAHPPSFMDVLGYVEKKQGGQLDSDAFDRLASDYRTEVAAPTLNRQKGAKKAAVDADLAAFDNEVTKLRNSRYKTQEEAKKGSALGDFLKSAGQEFGAAMGPGTLAYLARLGGGVASLGGLTPNSVSDKLFQISSPQQSDGKTDEQAGQDYAKLILGGEGYADPQFANLRKRLVAMGAAKHAETNHTTVGGLEQRWSDAARERSPLGATTGDIAALLSVFLGNDAALARLGKIPKLVEDASRSAKLARYLPASALTANRTATDTAAQNVNRGDDISQVMQQLAADQALGTVFNLMPGNLSGGVIKRALTGAGIGGAQTVAQSATDQALNSNNEGITSEGLLTNAGFQAALAAILGHGAGGKVTSTPKGREAPAAGAEQAPIPAATPAPTSEAPTAPVDFRADAAAQPLESAQFSKVQSGLLEKANTQSKKYKTVIANADTPEKVVERATQFAQRFAGANWDKLDADQRLQSIETMAAWLSKKNKIKTEDIEPHLESLRNPQAPETTTPPVTEQPLPPDITGQQVPGTVAQEAAPRANTPEYIPNAKYDSIWNKLHGGVERSNFSPIETMLWGAIESGKIKDRQQFDDVLQQAEAAKNQKNKLKAKPAAAPAPEATNESVAKTVNETLAEPEPTKEIQRNKLKAKTKELSDKERNKAYFQALINREKAPADAAEAKLRDDPAFNSAAEAMRQGKITNADELGLFLKEQKGTATVGDESAAIAPEYKNRQLSVLLGDKSTKTATVKARKYGRQVLDNLKKLGEKEADVRKMTLEQAEAQLQKLANTFTEVKPEPAPKKTGLKKADVKPVENPDKEPPPTKPKKALKKTSEKSQDANAKKGLKGTKTGPKSEAPTSNESGRTPLETKLHGRFEALPHGVLDELHDAIAEAQIGAKGRLTDLIAGLRDAGDINKDDAKWISNLAKEPIQLDITENNASGESSASLEAQRRLADEKAAGQTRAIIRRDGSVEPLTGADRVDASARAGEVIVQRGVGRDRWTVLGHGDDLSPEAARGKRNRAADELDALHEAEQHGHAETPERVGEHTLDLDEFEAIQFDRTKKNKTFDTIDLVERVTPIQTSRRIDKIIKQIQKGADIHETGRELQRLASELEENRYQKKFKQAYRDRRRGPEWVKAKLQRMVADYPANSDHALTAKFGLWLLDNSPHLADDLGISLREIQGDAAGGFNPLARIMDINAGTTNPTTAVHEILHASERLLPQAIQNKIRGEYIGRLQNKLKQQLKAGNQWAALYLKTAIKNFASPSDLNKQVMMRLLRNHAKDVPANEYYKYFDPSEYWAVEGTDILNRRYEDDSWIGKAKEWMNGFVQQVKSLLKLDSNHAIYKGLKEVLRERTGDYDNPKSEQLAQNNSIAKDIISDEQAGENPSDKELGYESSSESDVDPNMQKEAPKAKANKPALSDVTTAQRAIEQTMRADYGLEKAMQEMRRKGVKITEENNVEDASFRRNGLISEYNNVDFDEAFQPADNWLTSNYAKFGKTKQDVTEKLNKFFQNTHWLERVKTDWLMESPLKGEAELDRADLIEQIREGDIDPIKAAKELNTLVAKNATLTWEEWGQKNGVPMDTLKEQLAKLDSESGINQKSMAELNGLMDLARNRITERLQGAGLVDKADPWVKFYGWKWYVPLKGSAYGEGAADNNFDLIPTRRIALARLSKQIQAMEGRRNFAEKPFTRLFVDMARAGERQATAETVLDATYNLAVDHPKEVGAEIHTFTGRTKDGFVNTKTGEYVERLKAPKNGVIVNDGDTHHIIVLPEDSQLRRGLLQMNSVERPNALDRKVAKGTNVLARLYTTVHPGWQTFSGFIRDLSYIPTTLGATKFSNPLDAVPFFGNYAKNVMQAYRALPTLIPNLLGQSGKLRAMGEAEPDSWAGWVRRYEKAGGSNAFTKGFDIPGIERLMQSNLKDAHNVVDVTKWGWEKVLEYTGNYANFLESIGRVAGFKTLVDMGYTDTDAATQVRKTLDYSQSGIKGRRINSWLAFFRVAMTGADAMRRAFTKPTGGLDYKKMAAWQGFMGGMGSVLYMLATALLGQDEDGKDNIAKIEPELLTQKVFFPLGDKTAGVNLGLGLPQVLMAPGILATAVSMNHLSAEKAAHLYMDTIARNGPITPAGTKGNTPSDFVSSYVLGFTPTVVRPLVDIERNTNTFNSSIHTQIDNSRKYHSDQGRFNTQQVFKDAARWLREVTGGAVDYYPEDIRYLVQSYGGQLASDFVKGVLTSPNEQAGAVPAPNRLAGKLLVDTSHYMQNDMYETLDNLNDSNRRYQSLVAEAKDSGATDQQAKAQADQIVARDPSFRKELQAYKALDAARRDYQEKVRALKANKLVSDTRKRLERKRLDAQLRRAIEQAQAATE